MFCGMFLNDSLSVLIGLPLIYNPLFYVSHFISQNYKLQSHFYPARLNSANGIFFKKKRRQRVPFRRLWVIHSHCLEVSGGWCFLSVSAECLPGARGLSVCWGPGKIPPAASPLHIWAIRCVCHAPPGSDRRLTQFHVHPLRF